jgi:hypothetical protein
VNAPNVKELRHITALATDAALRSAVQDREATRTTLEALMNLAGASVSRRGVSRFEQAALRGLAEALRELVTDYEPALPVLDKQMRE